MFVLAISEIRVDRSDSRRPIVESRAELQLPHGNIHNVNTHGLAFKLVKQRELDQLGNVANKNALPRQNTHTKVRTQICAGSRIGDLRSEPSTAFQDTV